MKIITLSVLLLTIPFAAQASLKTGDSLTPYEIKNSRSGDVYCQICAYGARQGKIVAFGKLDDAGFWADLQKLQALSEKYPKLGVFAQVIDSKDVAAIKTAADKNGVKFPVVIPVENDWDEAYHVNGISRTIYYAEKNNKIAWITVGLETDAANKLGEKLTADFAG